MKQARRLRRSELGEHFIPCLAVLAICFFLGIVLGQVCARRAAAESGPELYRYLSDYFQAGVEPDGPAAFLSALLLYYRYPVLAFLLGFASVGLVGLPLLSAAFGFFLSFSVGCFASAFGGSGVLLAFSAMGLRCILTFPCYFWLAVPAFQHSVSLARFSFGGGRRACAVPYGSAYFLRFAVCSGALFLGVIAELYAVPYWVELVCGRIFG